MMVQIIPAVCGLIESESALPIIDPIKVAILSSGNPDGLALFIFSFNNLNRDGCPFFFFVVPLDNLMVCRKRKDSFSNVRKTY